MRLKNLFSVPAEENVTEKHLRRVLISSICSILLCMSCLAGTTWAWFVAGVENTENMIHIASPEVVVKVNDSEFASGDTLETTTPNEHTITLANVNGQRDAFGVQKNLYVTLLIDDTPVGYVLAESEGGTTITVAGGSEHKLSWTVSWTEPKSDDPNNPVGEIENNRFAVPANDEATGEQSLEGVESTGETAENDQPEKSAEPAEGEALATKDENGDNEASVSDNRDGEKTE